MIRNGTPRIRNGMNRDQEWCTPENKDDNNGVTSYFIASQPKNGNQQLHRCSCQLPSQQDAVPWGTILSD